MFFKIGAFKNFTIFAAKHLYLSLFYSKVVRLRPANLLKKKLWHRCFPVKKPERSGDPELGVKTSSRQIIVMLETFLQVFEGMLLQAVFKTR